jgi:integrin beta 8
LGSSGSCVEEFLSYPVVHDLYAYTYGGGLWLSSDTRDKAFTRRSISRCSVCKKQAKIVVRHGLSTTVPSCPTGSTELWTGYSLHGIYATRPPNYTFLFSMTQDLKSPGSCLREFRSSFSLVLTSDVVVRDSKDGIGFLPIWLAKTDNRGKRFSSDTISRCVVCEY